MISTYISGFVAAFSQTGFAGFWKQYKETFYHIKSTFECTHHTGQPVFQITLNCLQMESLHLLAEDICLH